MWTKQEKLSVQKTYTRCVDQIDIWVNGTHEFEGDSLRQFDSDVIALWDHIQDSFVKAE
jgi:hypothetical protein